MSRFDRSPDIPVSIGPCECPGTPHGDGDVVYLTPLLSAKAGMMAQGAISDAATDGVKLQELLWRIYRDQCVVGWNLLDDDGDPVPLTSENKDLALPFGKGGQAVAEKSDELYSEDVLRPFLTRMAALEKIQREQERERRSKRSKAGSTPSSPPATSARPTSITKRQSPSSMPGSGAATRTG